MCSYGDTLIDQTIVEKVLRIFPEKFDHVMASIEESKDLVELSFNQVMGSLQSREVRIKTSPIKVKERDFQTHHSPRKNECGGFRGCLHGRGFGRGRRRNNLYCSHCKRFGHVQNDFWFKYQQVNWVGEDNQNRKRRR